MIHYKHEARMVVFVDMLYNLKETASMLDWTSKFPGMFHNDQDFKAKSLISIYLNKGLSYNEEEISMK